MTTQNKEDIFVQFENLEPPIRKCEYSVAAGIARVFWKAFVLLVCLASFAGITILEVARMPGLLQIKSLEEHKIVKLKESELFLQNVMFMIFGSCLYMFLREMVRMIEINNLFGLINANRHRTRMDLISSLHRYKEDTERDAINFILSNLQNPSAAELEDVVDANDIQFLRVYGLYRNSDFDFSKNFRERGIDLQKCDKL